MRPYYRQFQYVALFTALFSACGCSPSSNDSDQSASVADVTHEAIINADSEPQNWLAHGRTYDEQRFSPLTQITPTNVAELSLEWHLDLGTHRGLEGTPIVVDGIMYLSGAWNNIYAVNAKTGEPLWHYDPKTSRPWVAANACCDAVSRGLAVWEGKVIAATLDGRLLALDAATGELLWSVLTIDRSMPYTITAAPRVIQSADGLGTEGKARVLLGNSGADYGVRGYVSAYDVNTGLLDWRFYTVPSDPSYPQATPELEMAVKTWSGDEWVKTGAGGTVWNAMAFDPNANLLYFGTGNGTPWSRELRSPGGGDNLFLSSIIAVNPDTGEYVWHYQTTPGESWNFSAVESIILTDLVIDGEPRKVLIQAPKNGFFYVLDRLTGELLSAEKYINANWASHIDMDTGRPVEYPFARYKNEGRLVVPGPSGGHSWHPMSYSPLTGLAYIPALSVPGYYNHDGGYSYQPLAQNTGIEEGVANYKAKNPQDVRQKLRFGVRLLAWDPVEQQERWAVDHGDLGAGTLVTAGNLVFQGLANGKFFAYTADTGERLWGYDTKTSMMAAPVTYAIDGEQYIAVLVGRGGGAGLVGGPTGKAWNGVVNENRVLAFKLGGTDTLPEKQLIPKTVNVPVALEALAADKPLVEQGKRVYQQYCYMCHGVDGMSGGVIPDLRFTQADTYDEWQNIVIGGSRANNGMRSFAGVITVEEAMAVRAYVVSRALRAKPKSKR